MRARSVLTIATTLVVIAAANGEEFRWEKATAASQGMSAETLDDLKDTLSVRKAMLTMTK